MKRTFTYIRNCLIDYYSQQEIESFISIIFNDIYNYSKNEIILNANKKLDDVEFIKIKTIVERLVNQEPIQYILGSTQFYDLTFFVNPAVLIPRNETEELVDLILKNHAQKKIKVLDVGTGSGCIPISIKKNNPLADLYSCDISERAIEVAKKNAELNKVNVSFFQFDILSNHPFPGKNFDVIVSNPPYVTEKEKDFMGVNVLGNEPPLALFVPDNDPLLFYKAIVFKAGSILNPEGEIYFEINEAYGAEVLALLHDKGYQASIICDIHGKERIVHGKKEN